MEGISLTYKIADSHDEFEQIYQLNYKTFVDEIPQHQQNQDKKLIDRFDHENLYVIAKKDYEVIGMICVRGTRPFSLDEKLSSLDDLLNLEGKLCEIRLLSIKQAYRQGVVFFRLCSELVSQCLKQGFTIAVISGTTRQLPLYKRIGFVPFGPLIGKKNAEFQPMYLTEDNFVRSTKAFNKLMNRNTHRREQHFLPGPVNITASVQKAWSEAPISHRSSQMNMMMKRVKKQLLQLTNGHQVEIAVGTGTLANDIVAAQLACMGKHGAIITSGEFGDRLITQAERWNLSFQSLCSETSPTLQSIEQFLVKNPEIEWVWTVHCETSTGYLYPLDDLKALCTQYGVELCLDACSSLGTIPVDLSGVYLASSVSGKGLASFPGLALVFHRESALSSKKVPTYLDLANYEKTNSIPYTHSSNALCALQKALECPITSSFKLWKQVYDELQSAGMSVICFDSQSPAILTIRLPKTISSRFFGDALKSASIYLSYESSYLLSLNWIQLALMGEMDERNVLKSVRYMTNYYKQLCREKAALL